MVAFISDDIVEICKNNNMALIMVSQTVHTYMYSIFSLRWYFAKLRSSCVGF